MDRSTQHSLLGDELGVGRMDDQSGAHSLYVGVVSVDCDVCEDY